MTLRRRTLTITIATLSAALAVGASASSTASAKSDPSSQRKIDGNVLAPFQIAVRNGTIWYSDGFAGTVTSSRTAGRRWSSPGVPKAWPSRATSSPSPRARSTASSA